VVECSAGGTGRHVLDLAEGLLARGCDVHLLYSPRRIDALFAGRLPHLPGLRATALPMRTGPHPSDLAAVWRVRRYLRRHGPFDAIHGHSSKGGAVARLAAVGTRVPAFYTLHGLIMMDPGLARWKRAFYTAVELALGLGTRHVIAVSPEEARAAVRLGLGRDRVTLIPNGLAPLDLSPRAAARRAIGVGDDSVVVGFVGRLVSQKAPEVLIRAFATVARSAPHARLAVVGDGPLERGLRELAAALGVADKLCWLGPRDARAVLAGFDLFALPSRKEGLPYVILEAMAAGLPCVATSSAGVEILIDPGVTGAVVPPEDPAALAGALAGVIADPGKLARYGQAARRRASLFTLDAMVDATLAAYAGAPVAVSPALACNGAAPSAAQSFTVGSPRPTAIPARLAALVEPAKEPA
jgi:glycosyltransferase involved in cell wall biosynthesis